MARAAFALWESTGDKKYLDRARAWVHVLNENFWDAQNGGYFYTSYESDPLIARSRMIFDQNTPSGNGIMVGLLSRLHFVTSDPAYRERSNALIEAFSGEVGRVAISMGSYLNGLETAMTGLQIVIVGPRGNPKTQELVAAVMGRSLPNRTLVMVEPDQPLQEGHPAAGKTMQNGLPTAYICQRATCSAPITNPVTLSQVLQLPPARPQGTA